jgi:hypothetical protein
MRRREFIAGTQGSGDKTRWHDDKAASRLAPKGDDGSLDFYVAMNGRSDRHELD